MLDLGVRISTDHDGVGWTLRFAANAARHATPLARTVDYEVRDADGGFALVEDGDTFALVGYPIDALLGITPRLYARAMAPHAGSTAALLFAGCVRVGGARLLLIGDEDSGRTALLAKLLLEGHAVEGDWCAVARGGTVTPVARALQLEQETVDAVPGVDQLVAGRPFVQDALLRKVWHVDTGAEIQDGAVDAVVVVESRHGGRSRLEPAPQYETAQDAVAALGMFAGEPSPPPPVLAGRVAEACAIVNGASSWRLQLGDLDEAVTLLGRWNPARQRVG